MLFAQIFVLQLGKLDPTELLRSFDIDSLTLQFVRDIETLSWVKDEASKRLGKQVYKQVLARARWTE